MVTDMSSSSTLLRYTDTVQCCSRPARLKAPSPPSSAVSARCRSSLLIDVTAVAGFMGAGTSPLTISQNVGASLLRLTLAYHRCDASGVQTAPRRGVA
ncbi:hypothetical protein D3C71_1758440 [compost metagenome]